MMPDILIRGMEMPQNCLFCPCSFWDERTLALWCHALSTYDDNLVAENVSAIDAHGGNPWKVKRPDFCPLVELPPHGDLIDLDHIEQVSFDQEQIEGKDFIDGALFMIDYASDLPVIVPAERRE